LARDPYHRLEFETTWYFLEKYLPPGGLVLDAGGGPGRYTVSLAQHGYQVVLLDLTQANLEFARRQVRRHKVQQQVVSFQQGSIVDLSRFADDSFDAVVCLGGPLSHVVDARKRQQAIGELLRVAKAGAPIFISVMSRLSVMVVELNLFPHEIGMPIFPQIRDTGDYHGGSGFTACHFFLPEEFKAECEAQGLRILEIAGLEGLGTHHRRAVNRLQHDEILWPIWKETHIKTCTHPAVVGTSEHMLVVGKKPG
jgi:ubiquinone/menaquinone biosynthesis C-methylase UbiE